MNALVCEMCGSNNVIKEDGMYICQSCGTKYSVEEAKKLMIEGTVDVSGSVIKVDNSSFVSKALENARRAKAKEDWEECEKYYNIVEQHEPHNIEAIFYSSYGKAKMAMVDSDRFKREQKINVLKKSISVIDDNYDQSPEKYEEQKQLIIQIDADISNLVNGQFVYKTTTVNGIPQSNDSIYTYIMFNNLGLSWIESLHNIIKIIPEKEKNMYLWKMIRANYVIIYMHSIKKQIQVYQRKIAETDAAIKQLDPSYVPPPLPKNKSGGCYVATCVYGSYDCPQVWTLRRYRDDTLAKTWYGRVFIHTYYALSPTIVRLFGNTTWFKKLWKGKLNKMVAELHAKGVKDTPYNDREW
ncbi:MAG: TFIIB-type zinc finger domain-containing protein [Ruminococcus sp.]|nr:TFIIB-type zinc finger domain-containing protein [Ruminococcus sp.]